MGEIVDFPWTWRVDMRDNGYDPDNPEDVEEFWEDVLDEAHNALKWIMEN